MKSQWQHKREDALSMRREGAAIRDIEIALGIPRSTLSGWFKKIVLSPTQRDALRIRNLEALSAARLLAAEAHKNMKRQRIEHARNTIKESLDLLPIDDLSVLELALAMLYLGEGSKTRQGLRLGNSDPKIVRFYINALGKVYGLPLSSLYFALHLRADQNEKEAKTYWSQTLVVPLSSFRYSIKDLRTTGKATRPDYHGVCLVQGGPVEIQRRLMYLSEAFCERLKRG